MDHNQYLSYHESDVPLGCVVKFSKEQDGSRFIQQRLAVADSDEVQLVFEEVMPAIEALNDVYGNFIVQKLLEFGTDDMKNSLAKLLRPEALFRPESTGVIQKAFDELSKADVASLISTFKGNVLLCLNDHNDTQSLVVVKKCTGENADNHFYRIIHQATTSFKSPSPSFLAWRKKRENGDDDLCTLFLDSIDPIVDEITESVEVLAQHSVRLPSRAKMVEYCIEPQRSKVLDKIIACQNGLLCHTYGNYVIQKVLEHGRSSDKDAIFKKITFNNSVVIFSKQKQASNVVEAMLRLGDAHHRQEIVQEMLSCFCVDHCNETQSAILSMSKDPYANYVVKTALEVLEEGPQRDQLYAVLLSHQAELYIVAMLNSYTTSGEEEIEKIKVEEK
ncbi:LOW QUALITY PROTEIN: hypothetical protein ACHAW5_005911 [Stephanodiscus triporus]|uniref:PUM-HD domain-containing protein n=1 Tax=Stephanodiscus triporus TaxID=2934178 RepID=A0ABD3NDW5_9STRA